MNNAGQQHGIAEVDSFVVYAAENRAELDRAAIKIQASYKGFSTRRKVKASRKSMHKVQETVDDSKFKEAAKSTQAKETENGAEVEPPENVKESQQIMPADAAISETLMKGVENGIKDKLDEEILVDLETCEDIEDYTKAAIKIQASYKGYKVRKELSQPAVQYRKRRVTN